jgi:hypothetical protein
MFMVDAIAMVDENDDGCGGKYPTRWENSGGKFAAGKF